MTAGRETGGLSAEERVAALQVELLDWAEGRRSYTNTMMSLESDPEQRQQTLVAIAQADAAEVQRLSAALVILATRAAQPDAGTALDEVDIEAVLAAHRPPVYGACSCGWITPSYLYGKTAAAWRSHVAAAIRAALDQGTP